MFQDSLDTNATRYVVLLRCTVWIKAFVFGLPESGNTPLCWLYNVPAAQIPPQSNPNLKVFDKACTRVPTAAPTQADSQANNGENQIWTRDSNLRNATFADIATQDDCLALCRQSTGCQAIEFGKPSANEPVQCLLFNVPGSQLPAPTNGQTFVAFDTGC
ncbi:hypothetical protein CPLU01_06233 [Colletotrichum plurivorum]|uniref:Apple domain-containing protein n=1 Tax=Colletotrichum plurivorum TaxID=2175906 RepID=A0A8H6KIM4_9PEZI|nr:hypothetical protein CPLU01_06233 [Colletotrichum plurivorum]